jgi:adenine-specific DNA-methyltransferase
MDMISFAHENGLAATQQLPRDEQKRWGQFMTPPAIAKVMAARTCARLPWKKAIRLLDPAAGTGILTVAVIQELLQQDERPEQICVQMFELDERLRPILKRVADRMRREGERVGVNIKVSIRIEDFLLSDLACDKAQVDLVIANPPYFKLNKKDERATRHSYAVYGQPNIYGLFMAACSRVLNPGGRWCFITPRSWTNGPYFALARRQMLLHLHIDAMHVFESRQEHFTDDEVLQEAMITWATAQSGSANAIVLSTSTGIRDLDQATLQTLPACEIISEDAHNTISLPIQRGVGAIQTFSGTLASYGLKVSTGPVVAFRAAHYLSGVPKRAAVPLLWMQHVQHMRISWPIKKKREHIAANAETAWMLVPNANMVVLRRFSPKEDIRRVTAAPYIAGSIPGSVLGLENHTNYIYRPGGEVGADEAKGLAAFLNSFYADSYLRRTSGNTQVNAADLRSLPLPSLSQLIEIGRTLPSASSLTQADSAVDYVLGARRKVVVA